MGRVEEPPRQGVPRGRSCNPQASQHVLELASGWGVSLQSHPRAPTPSHVPIPPGGGCF